MSFHASLQLTLEMSSEAKDGWVEENRNGDKIKLQKT